MLMVVSTAWKIIASIRKAAPVAIVARTIIIRRWDMCLSIRMVTHAAVGTTMDILMMNMAMTAAVAMTISMKMKNMLTHTVTRAAADMTMNMNMTIPTATNIPMRALVLTHMATSAVAAMTMNMNMTIPTATNMHTPMVTSAVVDMTIPMLTHTLTYTVTNAVADMTTATNTLIPMHITFLVTPLTASAKSAIRMRNTATFAARA